MLAVRVHAHAGLLPVEKQRAQGAYRINKGWRDRTGLGVRQGKRLSA